MEVLAVSWTKTKGGRFVDFNLCLTIGRREKVNTRSKRTVSGSFIRIS
jgi:hypothetical protein